MKYEFSVKTIETTEVVEMPDDICEERLLMELEGWVWDQILCGIERVTNKAT